MGENGDHIRSLETFVTGYLATFTARGCSPATVRVRGDALKPFLAFLAQAGVERFQDVAAGHLEAYRQELARRKLAGTSVYDALRGIKAFFAYLEAVQAVFVNPAQSLMLPKYQRRLMPVPTEQAVKELLLRPDVTTATGKRDRAMIEVAYSTGARLGELLRMNLLSVDRTGRVIRVVGKGRKERVLPLGKTALAWLETYLGEARPALSKRNPEEAALWVCRGGRRLQAVSAQLMIRTYSRAAGHQPALTPHALRRACATHMLRRGAHPVQLQMLLGHASLSTLSQYLRVTITDLQKAYDQSNPAK